MPRQGKALPDCLAQVVRVLSVPPVMVAAPLSAPLPWLSPC